MNLKVQKIDAHQFVGKDFTLVVTLPDAFPDISRRASNLPLKVDVCYEDEIATFDALDRNFNPNLMEVRANTNIDRSRRAVVTLRFNEPSVNHNNRKFVLRFTAFTLEGDITSVVGHSIPLTVVRFRLKIQEEFAERGSYIWMKDVGGKDKSIDLHVSLVDTEDKAIMNRRVPLKVMLLYSNGSPVPQQDILQLSPETQLVIGTTGSTRIKCRINEVSSRHQGQLFQIMVAPDFQGPSPLADISPARSVPVEVKSKINISHKRKLQALSESGGGTGSAEEDGTAEDKASVLAARYDAYKSLRGGLPVPYSAAMMGMHPSSAVGSNQVGLSLASPRNAGGVSNSAAYVAANFASILPMSSVLSSSSYADSATRASIGAGVAGLAALNPAVLAAMSVSTTPLNAVAHGTKAATEPALSRLSSGSGSDLPRPPSIDVSVPAAAPAAATVTSQTVTPCAPSAAPVQLPPATMRAIREVLTFAEAAYAALTAVQWTPIGHLSGTNPETGLPTGNSSGDRTLYSMPNPNGIIAALADRYQQVAPQMAILERTVSLGSRNASASALAGGARAANETATASMGTASNYASVSADMTEAVLASALNSASNSNSTTSASASGRRGPSGSLLNTNPGTPLSSGSEDRVVYLGRGVLAVQTLPSGEKVEHDLGAPAFAVQSGGQRQLVGFYSMDSTGKINYRDAQELLPLLQPAQTTSSASASTDNSSSNNTSGSQVGRAVEELLRQIDAKDMQTALPLPRGKKAKEFDLTGLYSGWRTWTAAEKLRVQIH